jgi:hypothetical protein
VLVERLGEPASAALVEMLGANHRACADFVMTQCAERFERRLVEETSRIRVEMAQLGASLRREMADLRIDLRHEMAANRVELLRWAFVFWAGQLASTIAIVGFVLRAR